MQKTNFKFEVLINDDASTDGTADIIREYEQKYPDIIKPIYQTENQYSKGVPVSATFNFPRVKGKYLAICEGDDYWTDPYKLQKQFDFMEANPEYSICTHIVKRVYEPPVLPEELIPVGINEAESFEPVFNDIFTKFFHPTSFFIRWNNTEKCEIPEGIKYGDKYIMAFFANYGKIKLLPEIMSVYRTNPNGVYGCSVIGSDGPAFINKTCIDRIHLLQAIYRNIATDKENFFKEIYYPFFTTHQYILLKEKYWHTFFTLTYKNANIYLLLLKHWRALPFLIWQDIYKLLKKLYKVITNKSE